MSLRALIVGLMLASSSPGCGGAAEEPNLAPFALVEADVLPARLPDVCAAAARGGSGEPLAGLAQAELRRRVVEAGMDGDAAALTDGRRELETGYDRLVAAADGYAALFGEVGPLMVERRGVLVDIAALDWQTLAEELADHERATMQLLTLLEEMNQAEPGGARRLRDRDDEWATKLADEEARWTVADTRLVVSSRQTRASHDDATTQLNGLCGQVLGRFEDS